MDPKDVKTLQTLAVGVGVGIVVLAVVFSILNIILTFAIQHWLLIISCLIVLGIAAGVVAYFRSRHGP